MESFFKNVINTAIENFKQTYEKAYNERQQQQGRSQTLEEAAKQAYEKARRETRKEARKQSYKDTLVYKDSLAKKDEKRNVKLWGDHNSSMICPHCQTKGQIHTKAVTLKKGLSGAKATGALLTGGLSMLATGLSRKENCTQAHCTKCNSTWFF